MNGDKNTKYTHITERCNSLIKTLTAMRLKALTGDSFSAAYWRLREGKGLLTPSEKQHLDLWCSLVTMVRKSTGSPIPLKRDDHRRLMELREGLLMKMEEYRDWLSNGSKPKYLHRCTKLLLPLEPTNSQIFEKCTYETLPFALSKHLEGLGVIISDIQPEQQEEVLSMVDFETLTSINEQLANELVPRMRSNCYSAAMAMFRIEHPNIAEPPLDKVWQIRTDMEHRSSKGANISFLLNWIADVPSKSEAHNDAYTTIASTLTSLSIWKAKKKAWYEDLKKKGEKVEFDSGEIYSYMAEHMNSVMKAIPSFK